MQSQAVAILSNPMYPRMAFSLAEAEVLSGLSRASLYRLIEDGKLDTVMAGGRRLVPATALRKLCGMDQEEA